MCFANSAGAAPAAASLGWRSNCGGCRSGHCPHGSCAYSVRSGAYESALWGLAAFLQKKEFEKSYRGYQERSLRCLCLSVDFESFYDRGLLVAI